MQPQSLRAFYFGLALIYGAGTLWTTLLLWQVVILTHSSLFVAIAAGSSVAPAILVGVAGPDWGFGGRMGLWLLVTGTSLALLSPWLVRVPALLITIGLIEGWISARVIPKAQAWLMSYVTPVRVANASSRFELASRAGMVMGPLLAGALITTAGPLMAILATASLFSLSGALWFRLGDIDAPLAMHRARITPWKVVWRDGFLMMALTVRAGANLLWPAFTVAIPLLIQSPWHAKALGYGTIRTIWGLSTVLGAWLVVPRLLKHLKASYFLSWIITGLAFWRIGLSPNLSTALIWVTVGALSSPIVHVALDSHIGIRVAREQQSGVFAIQRSIMAVVTLIGLGLVTGAISRFKPGPALSGAGIIMASLSIALWLLWTIASRKKRGTTLETSQQPNR